MPYTHSAQKTFDNLLKEKEVPKEAVGLAGNVLELCKGALGAEKFDELLGAAVTKTLHGLQSVKEAEAFGAFLEKNGIKNPAKVDGDELNTEMFNRL